MLLLKLDGVPGSITTSSETRALEQTAGNLTTVRTGTSTELIDRNDSGDQPGPARWLDDPRQVPVASIARADAPPIQHPSTNL